MFLVRLEAPKVYMLLQTRDGGGEWYTLAARRYHVATSKDEQLAIFAELAQQRDGWSMIWPSAQFRIRRGVKEYPSKCNSLSA